MPEKAVEKFAKFAKLPKFDSLSSQVCRLLLKSHIFRTRIFVFEPWFLGDLFHFHKNLKLEAQILFGAIFFSRCNFFRDQYFSQNQHFFGDQHYFSGQIFGSNILFIGTIIFFNHYSFQTHDSFWDKHFYWDKKNWEPN